MSRVYYNDNEPFVCDWLENLIREKLLPAGDVDRRPIQEVMPSDVQGYTQCHFFAGIGGWAYALQLAGWGDRPVWTGSCPCQPLSVAGKQLGHEDERHLWPEWHRLISECSPSTLFGEQVSSKLGRAWVAAVRADLEALEYAVGIADLCAASVGAPHIRQRLYFVADHEQSRLEGHAGHERDGHEPGRDDAHAIGSVGARGESRELAYAADAHGRAGECGAETGTRADGERGRRSASGGTARALADTERNGRRSWGTERTGQRGGAASDGAGFWSEVEWLECRDGKRRPTRPGLFPLAHGIPGRLGKIRAAGNAIVPQVAAAFISAYMDVAL